MRNTIQMYKGVETNRNTDLQGQVFVKQTASLTIMLRTLLCSLLILCSQSIYSQTADPNQNDAERFYNELYGSAVALDASFDVVDDKFCVPSEWNTIEQTNAVRNIIVFEIDRFSEEILQSDCTYDIDLQIDYWFADATCPYGTTGDLSELVTLQVQTQPTSTQPRAFQKIYFTNQAAHAMKVTVKGITSTASSFTCGTPVFRLYGEMLIDRTYDYNCNELSQILAVDSTNPTNGDVAIAWTPINGTDEYDMEYTFYDFESVVGQEIASNSANIYPDFNWLFTNNATRITTNNTFYSISARFPKGYVFCRVRSVHYKDGIRETGKWSSTTPSSTTLSNFDARTPNPINWHQDNLNWQGQVSFAEEGKNVPSINYFDGSLRQRQTVTRSNSNVDLPVIIQQNIYDYHGRPSMSIMAAPTENPTMGFDPSFAKANQSGIPNYTKENLFTGNASDCEITASALNNSTGAAKYYSSSNPLASLDENRYIPDAQGYPFSTTEYTPDQTGRLKRQSGVGQTFQLGNGHATKYFYGKPDQRELDRLFGNDVGYKEHYLKNMVIDANGQISLSYVDAHGRTIATALAGATPNNTDALKNNTSESAAIKHLLNNLPPSDGQLQSNETFLVTDAGDYTFNYILNPQQFIHSCTPTLCYDCVYDLEIIIQDNCDNGFYGGMPYDTIISNVSFGNWDTNCATSPTGFNIQFIIPDMPVGEYKTTKILRVSEAALEDYAVDFLAQQTCLPNVDTIYSMLLDSTTQIDCDISVADCLNSLDSINIVNDYILAHIEESESIATARPSLVDSANVLFALLVSECEDINASLTECDILYQFMLNELAPGGNYASFRVDGNGNFFGMNSDEGQAGVLSGNAFQSCFASAANPTVGYVDSVYILTNEVWQWTLIGDLPLDQFVLNWKPEWGDALVSKHPDYACYLDCIGHSDCFEFDEYLLGIETFQDAVDKGLIDPVTCEPMVLENDPCFECPDGGLGYDLSSQIFTQYANIVWRVNGVLYEGIPVSSFQDIIDEMNIIDPTGSWILHQEGNNYYALGGNVQQSYVGFSVDNNPPNCFPCNININKDYTCLLGINPISIQSTLDNVNPSSCVELSLTNLVSNLVYCNGEMPCTTPFGKGCTADNNRAWQLYRTMYLGEKRTTIEQEGICTITTALSDSNLGFSFGLSEVTQTELDQQAAQVSTDLNAQCTTTCEATAELWMQKLVQGCNLSPLSSAYSGLRGRMIAVCKDGCIKLGLSQGTTSLPQDSLDFPLLQDSSFVQILLSEPSLNLNECTDCSPYMMDYPGTYDKQHYTGALNATGLNQMDTCLCANLTDLQACYTGPANEFSSFLNEMSEVKISQAAIDSLLLYCTVSNCTNMDTAIIIPPYLNCNTCQTCADVEAIKNTFNCATNVANYEDRLAQYLNYKLGFTLSSIEYEEFFERCALPSTPSCYQLCPTSIFTAISSDTDCLGGVANQLQTTAQLIYDKTIDSLAIAFQNEYFSKCLDTQNELFFTTGEIFHEYQYTLYYYDQAGNLSKTIPPKGVKPLNSNTDLLNVMVYRNNPQGGSTSVFPAHTYRTSYTYNTLNQVIEQDSPDATKARFWYDNIGRVVASQDGRQSQMSRYSYTTYDALGRITEVGEVAPSLTMTDATARDASQYSIWLNSGSHYFVTKTVYDEPVSSNNQLPKEVLVQDKKNLRNRVSYVTHGTNTTFYNYDISGNVKTIVQRIGDLGLQHQFKRIDYEYDYISGNVNAVYYQKGKPDQYTYRYEYDSNNRLIRTHTSTIETEIVNSSLWETEATYQYYEHGPLARTEIGHTSVQGCDFAYTLQGWIKGMNSSALDGGAAYDMGKDGNVVSNNSNIGRDAVAYTLGYYNNDYDGVGVSGFTDFELDGAQNIGTSLYNGNIRQMTVDIKELNQPVGYTYEYDQLHRLKSAFISSDINTDSGYFEWNNNPIADTLAYFAYDENGNIDTLRRHQVGANHDRMDELEYTYSSLTNKLSIINDKVDFGDHTGDYDSLTDFTYDGSGNLITQCNLGGCETILWTPYGKVDRVNVYGTTTSLAEFDYGPDQNRVKKKTTVEEIYYIRDAQGNIMAVYEKSNTGNITWKEQHLYGSSRLGIHKLDVVLASGEGEPHFMANPSIEEGNKRYELSNHLGNVLAVVSDRKTPVDTNNNGTANYWNATTITANDYYPFGLNMNNRSYSSTPNEQYRHGFNGMEKDDNGEFGNQDYYSTHFRQYNPTIGRWMSPDPKAHILPFISPYAGMHNNPILLNDPLGDIPPAIWAAIAYGAQTGAETAIDIALGYAIQAVTGVPYSGWNIAADYATNLVPGWGELRTSKKVGHLVVATEDAVRKLSKVTGAAALGKKITKNVNAMVKHLEDGNLDAAKGTFNNLAGAINELRVVNALSNKFTDLATGVNGYGLQKMIGFSDDLFGEVAKKYGIDLKGIDYDIVGKNKNGSFTLGEIKSDKSYYDVGWGQIGNKKKGKLTSKIDAAGEIRKSGGNVDSVNFYFDGNITDDVRSALERHGKSQGINVNVITELK